MQPKTLEELKAHYSIFESVARIPELPCARVIAITMNKQIKVIEKFEDPIEKLIETYCVTDEAGKRIGVEYEVPGVDGAVATKARRDLTKGFYPYDWIELKSGKRVEFDKKLKALTKKPITDKDFSYSPIKISNREVRIVVPRAFKDGAEEKVQNVEITVPMIEVLEKKLPVQTLAFLLDTVLEYDGEY